MALLELVIVTAALQVLKAVAETASCPLDFQSLQDFSCDPSKSICGSCSEIWNRLNYVVAIHVRKTRMFLLPAEDAGACIESFKSHLEAAGMRSDLVSACGIGSSVLAQNSSSCPDFKTVEEYRRSLSNSQLSQVDFSCTDFSTLPSCGSCYTTATSIAEVTPQPCLNYSYVYAAGVVHRAGPQDPWVAFCFFYLRPNQGGSGEHKPTIILATVLPAGFVSLLSIFLWWYFRRKNNPNDSEDGDAKELRMLEGAVEFSIEELSLATAGFFIDNRVGSGGSGNVFKGTLRDGTPVAVKRFKNCSPAGDADFVNEVETIGSVRHRNLTPLLGWCVQSSSRMQHERYIVYEFMQNGSLQDHIPRSPMLKTWESRKKIIVGIARGLAYLHSGAATRIIHRDVKSSNILLDEAMNARISDMGLAKFLPEGMSGLKTGAVGTRGYVAPEYVLYDQLTEKSDVYSFGIVLLEVLTGNRALIPPFATPLADWAWSMVKAGRIVELFSAWDLKVEDDDSLKEMLRFLLVAFLCSHPYVALRPDMLTVVKMLEDGTGIPEMVPDRPVAFVAEPLMSETETASYSFSNSSIRSRD